MKADMARSLKKSSVYDAFLAVPENQVAEILNGALHTHPRPAPRHALAASALGSELLVPFYKGQGGPGGWIILVEPELHLEGHIMVPDLAGWRRERLPELPKTAFFELAPDWVCEILSPSTAQLDRTTKRDLYASFKVPHIWLVDPDSRTVECFELQKDQWCLVGSFADDDTINAPPFAAAPFSLAPLWLD